MQAILLKVRYFERGLSKSLEKGNFIFFQTQSLSIDKIIKNKKTIDETRLLLRLIQVTKQVQKIPLLVMYYLTKFDDVIQSSF